MPVSEYDPNIRARDVRVTDDALTVVWTVGRSPLLSNGTHVSTALRLHNGRIGSSSVKATAFIGPTSTRTSARSC